MLPLSLRGAYNFGMFGALPRGSKGKLHRDVSSLWGLGWLYHDALALLLVHGVFVWDAPSLWAPCMEPVFFVAGAFFFLIAAASSAKERVSE